MTTRDALGSQQETGDSGIVVGHRLGAVLDGGLGPSGATNSVGGERQRSASRVGTNACAFRPRHTIGTSTPAGSNPPPFIRLLTQLHVIGRGAEAGPGRRDSRVFLKRFPRVIRN